MTTAHRPTWAPAKGGEEQGGNRIFVPTRALSAKDQAAHTKLKFRQPGQGTTTDLKERDFRTELEVKERKHFKDTKRIDFEEERKHDLLLLEAPPDPTESRGGAVKSLVPRAQDADVEEEDDSDDESSDDEEDEEAELLRELDRIKKERAEEAAKKAKEEAEVKMKEREQELLRGNPLVNQLVDEQSSFLLKRRWDEDVVFKNQARGEPKAQRRFINDTIRSDFHKKFLHRYVR